MREKLTYEQKPVVGPESPGGVAGGTEEGGGKTETIEAGQGKPDSGVVFAPIEPKGSSITMEGAGRHDGSDIENSLSLLDMYNLILRDRAKQRRQE